MASIGSGVWIGASLAGALLVSSIATQGKEPQPPEAGTHLAAKLRECLRRFHAQASFPGARFALIDPDGQVLSGVVGEVGDDQPLREDHRIYSGSIGKLYVASLILRRVAAGKLALDDKLEQHLGSEPWFESLPNAKEITIGTLLRHRSGIPEHVWLPKFQAALREQPDRTWRPAELIAFILGAEPTNAVDEAFSYADTNYVLLGMVLEHLDAEHRSYHDQLEAELLEPLGLHDTVPLRSNLIDKLAPGRTVLFRPRTKPSWSVIDGKAAINPQFEYCGGGLACTTTDLARFGRLLFTTDRVLDAAHRKILLDAKPATTGPGDHYGHGAMVLQTPHGRALGHTGIMIGALSIVMHYPELNLTAAMQWNTDIARQLRARPRTLLDRLVATWREGTSPERPTKPGRDR